jgi:hypothetical protein
MRDGCEADDANDEASAYVDSDAVTQVHGRTPRHAAELFLPCA